MPWTEQHDAICDTCGVIYLCCAHTRHEASERLRSSRWHHWSGETIGGAAHEAILCPRCAKDERKRQLRRSSIEQDTLPIKWESP